MSRWIAALACLAACGDTVGDGADDTHVPSGETSESVTVQAAFVGAPVIDPKLEGGPTMAVEVRGVVGPDGVACSTSISASNAVGQVRTWAGSDRAEWDGRDADGVAFDPGEVVFRVSATCEGGATAEIDLVATVVRLGVQTIDWVDHPDEPGNVMLAYHKADFVTARVVPIGPEIPEYAIGRVDDETGAAAAPIEPWHLVDVAPWGDGEPSIHNVPAGYVAGAVARLQVTPGHTAVSERTGVEVPAVPAGAPPIRAVLDGVPSTGSWADATVEVDLNVPDTVGRHDLLLQWSFEAEIDGTWQPLAGQLATEHTLYTLVGQPSLRDGTDLDMAPGIPWIAVLEWLSEPLDGLPADVSTVLDAIRSTIYENNWLVYNPSDSDYSDYVGPYIWWDYNYSQLSDWLDRNDGVDMWCHSVSCLFSVTAGMAGIHAPQYVLGVGFGTNQTLAAGTDTWERWSFNAHSVISPDGGETMWDAAVNLDGDGDPYNLPAQPIEPSGLTQAEYFSLLTYDDIGIENTGLCYFY